MAFFHDQIPLLWSILELFIIYFHPLHSSSYNSSPLFYYFSLHLSFFVLSFVIWLLIACILLSARAIPAHARHSGHSLTPAAVHEVFEMGTDVAVVPCCDGNCRTQVCNVCVSVSSSSSVCVHLPLL